MFCKILRILAKYYEYLQNIMNMFLKDWSVLVAFLTWKNVIKGLVPEVPGVLELEGLDPPKVPGVLELEGLDPPKVPGVLELELEVPIALELDGLGPLYMNISQIYIYFSRPKK